MIDAFDKERGKTTCSLILNKTLSFIEELLEKSIAKFIGFPTGKRLKLTRLGVVDKLPSDKADEKTYQKGI